MNHHPKIHRPTATTLLALAALAVIAAGCGKTAERNDAAPVADTVQIAMTTIDNGDGTFTDTRDAKTYRMVRIGNQTWMAENLNYKIGKSVCYDNKESNCQQYGRLYDWKTALKACPAGWHIPSDAEWEILVEYVDPDASGDYGNNAGMKLKSKTGWSTDKYYEAATDDYGFSALPGGYRDGGFYGAGNFGYWWSATEYVVHYAWYRDMNYNYGFVRRNYINKTGLFSLRCVEDNAVQR